MAEPELTYDPAWQVYRRLPGMVLGFHGCDESVGEEILSGKLCDLEPSVNEHDWLGSGIYFWESDPWRAKRFAHEAAYSTPHVTRGKIKKPFVIGAVIDLGNCCNLLDVEALDELRRAYEFAELTFDVLGEDLPKNKGRDMGARNLDCLVVETMHKLRQKSKTRGGSKNLTPLPPYDTVRAAFIEGKPLYSGAGFHNRNHIQIAVRNPKCIKGYFRPIRRP